MCLINICNFSIIVWLLCHAISWELRVVVARLMLVLYFSLIHNVPLSRLPPYSAIDSAMPRRYRGLAVELRHRYVVTWSDNSESCDSVCARRGRACSLTGMWLLSSDCDILVSLVQACRSCAHDVISMSQIRTPVFDEHSHVCRIGSIHFLSCHARSSFSNRSICAWS